METTIMLVDDHAVVRMGFRMLLESLPGFKVTAEAGDGESALQLCAESVPDVVVSDLSMPGIGGLDFIERLKSRHPRARMVVLSAHDEPIFVRRAMAAGALGYLCKRGAPERLVDAVRRVAEGKRYLDPALAERMALEDMDGGDPVEKLTSREFEVFLQLARGRAVAQIAKLLFLSPGTVGTHLYHVKQKLGVSNAAELAMMAVQRGLIMP